MCPSSGRRRNARWRCRATWREPRQRMGCSWLSRETSVRMRGTGVGLSGTSRSSEAALWAGLEPDEAALARCIKSWSAAFKRRWAATGPGEAGLARELHAKARTALLATLLSMCFPPALPAALFFGWRVRARARRELPLLAEWVSLPLYLALAVLWIGVIACVFGLFILPIWLRS